MDRIELFGMVKEQFLQKKRLVPCLFVMVENDIACIPVAEPDTWSMGAPSREALLFAMGRQFVKTYKHSIKEVEVLYLATTLAAIQCFWQGDTRGLALLEWKPSSPMSQQEIQIAEVVQQGESVDLFERQLEPGMMVYCNLLPAFVLGMASETMTIQEVEQHFWPDFLKRL